MLDVLEYMYVSEINHNDAMSIEHTESIRLL